MQKLWIICDEFYPDDGSTALVLTKLAAELARENEVHVLTSRDEAVGRSSDEYEGVRIHRVRARRASRRSVLRRLADSVRTTCATFAQIVLRLRRGDVLICTTNPPTLTLPMAFAARLRGAAMLLLVHDVYPNVLAAAGVMSPRSPLYRIARAYTALAIRGASATIAIGRDMARLLRNLGGAQARIVTIPNWADVAEVRPLPRANNRLLAERGLATSFVVQYAGNLGRTHDIGTILDAARLLRSKSNIHFLFAGSGAKLPLVERAAAELPNVTLLPRQPRAALPELLAACDVSIISFMPGMSGVSVPSRMYNILASGRPILAVCEEDSELATLLDEHRAGWRTTNDATQLAQLIEWAAAHRDEVQAAGARGTLAAQLFTLDEAGLRYRELVRGVGSGIARREDGDAAAVAPQPRPARGQRVIDTDDAADVFFAEMQSELPERDERIAKKSAVMNGRGAGKAAEK